VAYCMQLTGHSPVEADETHEVFRLPDSSAENRIGYLRRINQWVAPTLVCLAKGASNSKFGVIVNGMNIVTSVRRPSSISRFERGGSYKPSSWTVPLGLKTCNGPYWPRAWQPEAS